jgi:hypothetical protein
MFDAVKIIVFSAARPGDFPVLALTLFLNALPNSSSEVGTVGILNISYS